MSFHLKASKAMRVMRAHPGAGHHWRGDPGLNIGKLLGGIVSAVIPGGGAIVGGINALGSMFSKKKSPSRGNVTQAGTAVMPAPSVGLAAAGAGAALLPSLFPFGPGQGGNRALPTLPGQTDPDDGGIPSVTEYMRRQGVRGLTGEAAGGCPRGYHPNKTGYYTSQGYVAPGSACVKNRKRNPLNPRAASRAMARLEGARKATRAIQKFFGGTKRHSHAARGGCGCRGKRR